MTSRRILFLLPTTGFGGAELHSLTLARHMLARGDEPVVAFPFTTGTARIYQQCLEAGIEMLDMPIAQLQMASPAESLAEQSRRLTARLVPGDYDAVVVAAPSPLTAIGLLDALADTSLPGICIFHLVADTLVIPPFAALSMLRSLSNNFRFVGVSEFSRDMLCRALRLDPLCEFIDYIPNGSRITIEDPSFSLRGTYVHEDQIAVVTVGRIHPQKGGEFLVRAIPDVLEQCSEARFLWFGEGPQQEELERLARELGVAHALKFPGYTARSAEIMSAADLVVLPTLYEGLSLTLLEAMHCGAAIITTDASYQDRILTDGVDGGIVPRREPAALAEKIVGMLRDETVARSCRANVRKLAQYYSEARMLEDYSRLLDQLMAEPVTAEAPAITSAPDIPVMWVLLREDDDGHRLSLLADASDGIGRPIAGVELLQDPAAILADLGCVGLIYAFAGQWETWVAPQSLAACAPEGGTWGGLLLDLVAGDRQHQSARAFALYDIVCDALAETELGPVALSLLEALLRFQERHCFDLSLSLRPLRQLRDPMLRRQFILGLNARDLPPMAHSGARLAKDLELSRLERALLLEGMAQARGDETGARNYGAIRAALEGGTAPLPIRPERMRVLFFAEHFNYPPANGGDRRILSLLMGYQELGFEVHFCGLASSRLAVIKATQAARMGDRLGIKAHYVHLSEKADTALREAHAGLARGDNTFAQFYDSQVWRDVRALAQLLNPGLVHVNYCYFSWIASATEGLGSHRVLDTHDLISRRMVLNRELLRYCGDRRPHNVTEIPGSIHVPERFAALRYEILPEEIDALMQFDTVLMISPNETATVRPMLARDSLRTLEMHIGFASPVSAEPGRSKIRALFAGGNNLYNLTGAAALRNHVLPYLEARLEPEEAEAFTLRISGDIGTSIPAHNLLELIGRIPDIEVAYIDVDFAFCSTPAGTGQNVKIIEAISHGIPVIAYTDIGRSANVIPGVNGLLAGTLSELREITLELIRDRERLEELKSSTRAWARQRYVTSRFQNGLRSALETTGFNVSSLQGNI